MSNNRKRKFYGKNTAAPIGTGGYMWVHQPSTKFDPDGVYEVTVTWDKAEVADLERYLEGMLDEYTADQMRELDGAALGKFKNAQRRPVFQPVYDEQGNETGMVKTKFKLKAKVRFKDGTIKENKPFVVDAAKQETDAIPFSGSRVRVVFRPEPYYMPATGMLGMSMRLVGVQIIELVEGGTAGDGLSALSIEDGYVEADASTSPQVDSSDAIEADEIPF